MSDVETTPDTPAAKRKGWPKGKPRGPRTATLADVPDIVDRLEGQPEPPPLPSICQIHSSVVVGGQTLRVLENRPKSNLSFSVDWQTRCVVVRFRMPNGKTARGTVPFENVANIEWEPEEE